MSTSLRIRDHGELQAAVLRASFAGGLAGLLAWRWPGVGAQVVGLLALGMAAVPPRSVGSAALAATAAVLGGVAWSIGGLPGLVGLACLGGLTFARQLPGLGRKLVAATAGAVGLGAGWSVASTIGASDLLGGVPPGLAALALGAATGFIASLGVTGRELEWGPSEAALPSPAAAPPLTDGGGVALGVAVPAAPVANREIDQLLARAQSAFRDAKAALGDEAPEAKAAAEDLLQRIVRFAGRWSDLDAEAARTDRLALATRLDDVGAREEAARDEVVKAEYGRARAALRGQLEYLDGIEQGRERAVARLHHHIAVMERLRLAALHHRSADASRIGEDLAPLVEDLNRAGQELDTAAEILAELPALPALAS